MPAIEGDEEVKEGKGLTILTPNKLWTRLLVLLSQVKAGNNFTRIKKWNQKNTISFVSTW